MCINVTMAGIMVGRLGVTRQKKRVASLKIWENLSREGEHEQNILVKHHTAAEQVPIPPPKAHNSSYPCRQLSYRWPGGIQEQTQACQMLNSSVSQHPVASSVLGGDQRPPMADLEGAGSSKEARKLLNF